MTVFTVSHLVGDPVRVPVTLDKEGGPEVGVKVLLTLPFGREPLKQQHVNPKTVDHLGFGNKRFIRSILCLCFKGSTF